MAVDADQAAMRLARVAATGDEREVWLWDEVGQMAAEGAGARREHQRKMLEEEPRLPDFGCGVAGSRQIHEVR